MQAFVHASRKLEASQVLGELKLDENLLRHAVLSMVVRRTFILHGQPADSEGRSGPARG